MVCSPLGITVTARGMHTNQVNDSLCRSPRQVDVCSHWQVGPNLGKLASRQQSLWANSQRSRDRRESGRGSSNFAGARLGLHSKFSYQIADARSFYYSSSLIKVLFLVICVNGEYWHALWSRRLKASKNAARLLPTICWGWLLAADPSWMPAWSNVLCGDFYLFHEKIIYILMPEPEVEYNFERTTPNRRCNINGRCCSSGTSADSWKSERLRSEVTTHGYDREPPFRLSGASDLVRASKLPLPSDPRCYMGADEHQRGCSAFNKSGPGRWKPV